MLDLSKAIKAIGIVLAFIGVVLIGFFDYTNPVLGSMTFPFVGIIGLTGAWWNTKLWGLTIGFLGVILLKYG